MLDISTAHGVATAVKDMPCVSGIENVNIYAQQTMPVWDGGGSQGKSRERHQLEAWCRRERHLLLKVQTLLNPGIFALTWSRTQDLRFY